MQVTELKADGLSRTLRIALPATAITTAIGARIAQLGQSVRVPGFRPGKVPASVVQARYGDEVRGEVINELVALNAEKAIQERKLRPAQQPRIALESDGTAESDLAFTVELELMPDITMPDFSKIKLEKLVTVAEDGMVDDRLTVLAEQRRAMAPADAGHAATDGDVCVIDFAGTVDGVARPGMEGSGHSLRLGSNRFIPGFEAQLVGSKAGETRTISVTFPADYHAADLAGKVAAFTVTVHEIKVPQPATVDDALAQRFGLTDLAALRTAVRQELQSSYDTASSMHLKRQLMDALEPQAQFTPPPTMLAQEFAAIWQRVQQERAAGQLAPEDQGKDDATLEAEYRAIASRRVRLGLLLAEVGELNRIQVSEGEWREALRQEAGRFPGQEQAVMDFYRRTPQARERLRAPLFEAKVTDWILAQTQLVEKSVTPAELLRQAGAELEDA